MVSKLVLGNVGVTLLLILVILGGMSGMMQDVKKHGFTYKETVIIGDVVEVREISHQTTLFSLSLMTLMVCVFIIDTFTIHKNTLTFSLTDTENMGGITFPKGEPKHWYVEIDKSNQALEVGIDDIISIKIPIEEIMDAVHPSLEVEE